ncbi:hypothetical protein CC86DRAFT_404825 [Ophiobolus disseminans]|uniref:Uncharacterized protein n=1 Tax=Ophiobolus disseminans TaxID=1469910 RepID=A0A6A7A4S2_9PLEO|nr:hypothetical protein CC86DRAFT_404825 [Ophiobolus disseminans]
MKPPGTDNPYGWDDAFRFLDLPKDIRLIVYDLLPTVARHHTIFSTEDSYSVKIVTECLNSLSLLRTCRIINDEAVTLHRKLEKLQTEPLRLIVHWRSVEGPALQAVLLCAANAVEKGLNTPAQLDEIHRRVCSKFGPPIPSTSHNELHALLSRNWPSGATKRVEVAVGCTEGVKENREPLYLRWREFYDWIRTSQDPGAPGQLDVVLRLMPVNAEVAAYLEGYHRAEYVDRLRLIYGYGHGWRAELGEWVSNNEWFEKWDEGEKV